MEIELLQPNGIQGFMHHFWLVLFRPEAKIKEDNYKCVLKYFTKSMDDLMGNKVNVSSNLLCLTLALIVSFKNIS